MYCHGTLKLHEHFQPTSKPSLTVHKHNLQSDIQGYHKPTTCIDYIWPIRATYSNQHTLPSYYSSSMLMTMSLEPLVTNTSSTLTMPEKRMTVSSSNIWSFLKPRTLLATSAQQTGSQLHLHWIHCKLASSWLIKYPQDLLLAYIDQIQ
jgi:hypothetical protein